MTETQGTHRRDTRPRQTMAMKLGDVDVELTIKGTMEAVLDLSDEDATRLRSIRKAMKECNGV